MNIKIRYLPGAHQLDFDPEIGDWIDLYACGDTTLKAGDSTLISLGVAVDLPLGFEANIVPRSSTFKKYGILQTNHFGVIDNLYNGDQDVWMFPAYATRDTLIPDGARICQFRLNKTMKSEIGEINFIPVLTLGNANRGGFGSTGG